MARPSSGTTPKKGKKNRKHNRNSVKCARYRSEKRLEKNKARKAAKRLRERENWLANRAERN